MAEVTARMLLAAAICDSLRACGTGLLKEPRALYATLADLTSAKSAEMRALRGMLVDSEDGRVLVILAQLNGASSVSDVEAAAWLIRRYLVVERMLAERVSISIAEGLAEGMTRYLGIALPGGRIRLV